MHVVHGIDDLNKVLISYKSIDVGFVPTMGSLHAGHLSLVRESVKKSQKTVVSIFVNPTQFGEGEDFDAYPRALEQDVSLLGMENVDVVFVPLASEIYRENHQTMIKLGALSKGLCGASRPGHFEGMATIVLKLLNIICPTYLFLGKKDYQQYLIVRTMIEDLNLKVTVVGVDTYRECDGLALSSRNIYLDPVSRKKAPLIREQLLSISKVINSVDDSAINKALSNSKAILLSEGFDVEYIIVCSIDDLKVIKNNYKKPLILLCAAKIGQTRLIDNLECI